MASNGNAASARRGYLDLNSGMMLAVSALSIAACFVIGQFEMGNSFWGLFPIVLYAVLCIWGLDIVLATVTALIAAFAILQAEPSAVGKALGASLGETVTLIGMVSVLGAGLGEVLRSTGVAGVLVHSVLKLVGQRSVNAVIVGIMFACMLVVAMLGTIGGSLAIVAPILIAVATTYGVTRRATAAAFMYGGCAGLALAPFAGSNIAIMVAADVGYLDYLIYGAGPLAIISVIVGLPIIFWLQKRAATENDYYEPIEDGEEKPSHRASALATAVFVTGLLVTIAYSIYSKAGISVPVLALPLLAFITGTAGGNSPSETLKEFYRGAGAFIHLFLLFWMLAALFNVIDELGPFETLAKNFSTELGSVSPFIFAVIVAFVGLFGVPGASAAVVVLVDQIFGGLASQVGISVGAWIIVLIFSSKGDTYGPFPNANMVTCMGMARYDNLKYMLLAGWFLLIPATIMYVILLYFVV